MPEDRGQQFWMGSRSGKSDEAVWIRLYDSLGRYVRGVVVVVVMQPWLVEKSKSSIQRMEIMRKRLLVTNSRDTKR